MYDLSRLTGWMRFSLCTAALLAFAAAAPGELDAQAQGAAMQARDVTFTRDVAPILQAKCVQCHRPNGVAPMSLQTYEEVRPWASVIKLRTGQYDRAGAMPPWYAERDIGIQQYRNDMGLPLEDIATIAAWVDAGAPMGDPADMPALRTFDDSDQWRIRPDLIVESEEFFVEGGAPDYWGDIIPIEIPIEEDRYVAAVEVKEINDVPQSGTGRQTVGGRFVVHHLNYVVVSPNGDNARFPVHEVGRNEDVFDAEAGRLLRAGSVIRSESLHLHSNGRDTRAKLQIAFQFHPEGYEPRYRASAAGIAVMGNTIDMDIKANEAGQELHAYAVLDDHTKILAFEPHLHAPGERMCLEAIWGSRTETLSCVGYDHSWVRTYKFAENYEPLLPAGTILHIIGYMNNSETNPNVSYPDNWMGGGNRSVSNMFLELGESVRLTDDQFVEEMERRVQALGLTKADYQIGCPLCLATIPPPPARPAQGREGGEGAVAAATRAREVTDAAGR